VLRPELAEELLVNAGVYNVVLRRDAMRELVLARPLPDMVAATYDLRDPGPFVLIRDALARLADPEPRVIRVIGDPLREAGMLIEVTMPTAPLREAMIGFGLRTGLAVLLRPRRWDAILGGDLAVWPLVWLAGLRRPGATRVVALHGNDIVFADRDGVVVIPVREVDASKIVKMSEERAHDERRSRQEIRAGRSLKEVYQKYGRL